MSRVPTPSSRRRVDGVEVMIQREAARNLISTQVQTLFLIWLVLGIGGLLTLVALCIAPCVTPALFPDDNDAEDDPKKYDEDPEASEASEAKEGDEPAWHGSSVEVDDLWPKAQEVSPRSMEL